MFSPLHNQHCSVWQSTAPTPTTTSKHSPPISTSQQRSRTRVQVTTRSPALGQVENSLAASLGASEAPPRSPGAPQGAAASVQLQLGRLEEALLEVHEPQEVEADGPVQEDG